MVELEALGLNSTFLSWILTQSFKQFLSSVCNVYQWGYNIPVMACKSGWYIPDIPVPDADENQVRHKSCTEVGEAEDHIDHASCVGSEHHHHRISDIQGSMNGRDATVCDAVSG